MWHVYKNYKRNAEGMFEEIVPAYYSVLPDNFEQMYYRFDGLSGYEYSMWKNGYMKAYTKYYGDGIVLNKGDYFKVLYDSGNNYIC